MARFYLKLDTFNIDFHKFTKAMERDCDKLLKLGAQKWLLAVLSRIPIRTGFLAGAFTPLENLVGVAARDAATGKTTGKIMSSRNPLLTREKKIQLLKKKLTKIEKDLEVDIDAYNKLKGEIQDSRVKRKKLAGDEYELSKEMSEFREKQAKKTQKLSFEQKIAQENEYRRELMRRAKKREREILEDLDKIKTLKRIRKRIEKLEKGKAYKAAQKVRYEYLDRATGKELKGPGGRKTMKGATDDPVRGMSANEVRIQLEKARKEYIKIMGKNRKAYNPKLIKEFITGKVKIGKKTKILKVRKISDTHPISRYIAQRENIRRQMKAEEKKEKRVMTMAERIRAKQQEKGMVTKIIQETTERVKTGSFILKRRESSFGKDILAFNEYYKFAGGKILKTPRSGIRFAVPKNPDEIFSKFSGAERAQFQQQIDVVNKAKSQVDAFLRFREQFNKTTNAESTIKGTIAHSTTPPWVAKQGATAPNIPTGPIPDIKNTMDKTYKEIMTKTRTDKMFFSFRFGVNIRYWDINDRKLSWLSRVAGEQAFSLFLKTAVNSKTQFRALTNLQDFMVRTVSRFDGRSVPTFDRIMRGLNSG